MVCLAVGVLLSGCPGSGRGWIAGSLWMQTCSDDAPLGVSPKEKAEFDLNAGFFAAEPFEDSNPAKSQRRNSLTLRIQRSSNQVEVSDGVLIQMNDLALAAGAMARSEALPITSSQLCPGGSCALTRDAVRASVYLYATCPQGRAPLVAVSHEMAGSAEEPDCLVPTGAEAPPCAPLSDASRSALDRLCEGDFSDRTAGDTIASLLGRSCMYLCTLGGVERGQDSADLDGFYMSFGDRVAGILSFSVVDGRAINLQTCARAAGELRGMFDFEITRGQAAQNFP